MTIYDQPVSTYSDTTPHVRVIADVINMIDPTDTPVLAALGGLDTARAKFKIGQNGYKIEILEDELDPLTGACNHTTTIATIPARRIMARFYQTRPGNALAEAGFAGRSQSAGGFGNPPRVPITINPTYFLHLPLLHLPAPAHSESKLHLPSGAFEHLPLLHLAPPPPQSESKLHLPPAAVAHLPLWHFTPAPQSESKLHLPSLAAEAWEAAPRNITDRSSAKRLCLNMVTSRP